VSERRPPVSSPLTRERWAQLEPLIDAALDLPPDRRHAYGEQITARDAALGAEVARFIADFERDGDEVRDVWFELAANDVFALLSEEMLTTTPARDVMAELQASLGAAYTLERELGGGGMSRVFVASDHGLHRKVVIKVLAPELAAGISNERFEREIRFAASLQQANIVPLHAAGRAGSLPYYTMPLVDGLSLRQRLARDGALPIAEAIGVLRDIARALAYAHERGVVHRDIKPANILLSGGTAVVADFGIAKAIGAARTGAPGFDALSQTGMGIGTPAYMAPEQAAGDPASDERADLYSLGVVAYELLVGSPPFERRSLQDLLAAHLTEAPVPVAERRADVPPELSALVTRLLAKRPEDRPGNARDVLDALGALTTPSARRPQSFLQRLREIGWRRAAAGVTLLGAVAGVLVIAGSRWFGATMNTSAREKATAENLPKSIAVLPLVNEGSDTSNAYFAAGMTEEITGALAGGAGLRVQSYASVASLVDTRSKVDPHDAGRRLGVQFVVAGEVRRRQTQLRLSVELVSVADGTRLWGQLYTSDVKDAWRVPDSVAEAIASALHVRFAPTAQAAQRRTENSDAHDRVLRARYQANLYTDASLKRAIKLYHEALLLDSAYADAWSGLSAAWGRYADDFIPAREALPHQREAIARALAIDSTADAHAQYAGLLGYMDRNHAAADREYTRALVLDSTLTSAAADYANILSAMGHADSAVAVLRRAYGIDPMSPYLAFWGPLNFIIAGDIGRARTACVRADEVSLNLGHRCRVYLQFADGQYAAMVDTLRAEAAPTPWTHAQLAAALARLGKSADARTEAAVVEDAAKKHYLDERIPAQMYAVMGDNDHALAWLESGFQSNAAIIAYMNVYPQLGSLAQDQRYRDMLKRADLQSTGVTPHRSDMPRDTARE
jgi:eukaryotic-like serine/threonine-protein kinase